MENILKEIKNNFDEKYANFSGKLLPNIDKNSMCGIRIPNAKSIAKKYANTDSGMMFLNNYSPKNLDEKNVFGLMLGYLKNEQKMLEYLDKFLPLIDNWCTCDITVANLKIIKKRPQNYKKMAFLWLKSDNFYIKRFAIVVLLTYFLDDYFDEKDLYFLAKINTNDYYVNMALSWYFCTAIIKQFKATIKVIENNIIESNFVHNKAIQKCCESLRVCELMKSKLKTLKRV